MTHTLTVYTHWHNHPQTHTLTHSSQTHSDTHSHSHTCRGNFSPGLPNTTTPPPPNKPAGYSLPHPSLLPGRAGQGLASPRGATPESGSSLPVVPRPSLRPGPRATRPGRGRGRGWEQRRRPSPGPSRGREPRPLEPGAWAAPGRSLAEDGGAAEGAASAARPHPSPRLTWPSSGSGRVTWCRRPGPGALRWRAGRQGWGPALRSPQRRGRAGCGAPSERRAAAGAGAGGGQATEAGFPGDQEGEAGGSRPRAPPPPPPPRRAAEPRVRRGRGTELPAPAPDPGGPRSQPAGGCRGLRGAPASLSGNTGEA